MQLHNISKDDYEILAGCSPEQIIKSPLKPFSSLIIDFLGDLSKTLMSDKEARQYPDVISFAFWLSLLNKTFTITQLSSEITLSTISDAIKDFFFFNNFSLSLFL